jgi:hypothetical protein
MCAERLQRRAADEINGSSTGFSKATLHMPYMPYFKIPNSAIVPHAEAKRSAKERSEELGGEPLL